MVIEPEGVLNRYKSFINKRIKKISVAILAIICALGVQFLLGFLVEYIKFENMNSFLYRFPIYRVFEFVMGCLCGFVFIQMSNSEVRRKNLQNIAKAKISVILISVIQVLLIAFNVIFSGKVQDARYRGYAITILSLLTGSSLGCVE